MAVVENLLGFMPDGVFTHNGSSSCCLSLRKAWLIADWVMNIYLAARVIFNSRISTSKATKD
jgi:hypothetical protein